MLPYWSVNPIIRPSALKHGLTDVDIRHALELAIYMGNILPEPPIRRIILGPAPSGLLLEVVVLVLDDGRALVIHAMKMRRSYAKYLEGRANG